MIKQTRTPVTRRYAKITRLAGLSLLLALLLPGLLHAQAPVSIRDAGGALVGRMYSDGSLRDSAGALMGRVQADGGVRDKSGARIGKVDGQGQIRDATGKRLGSIDSQGRLRDAAGKSLGKLDARGSFRDASGRLRLSFRPYSPDQRSRAVAYIVFFHRGS